MRKLLLTTAAVAAAIGLVGCPKTLTREPVSETQTQTAAETDTVAGMITDARDGRKYKTARMPDDNTWMAQNLNYKTDSSWCDTDSCKKYGRLYAWTAAMNACPAGYHLPSDAEWDSLLAAAGGYHAAGKKLKSKSGWNSYNGKNANGTDDYGFSALPGGYRFPPAGSNDTAGYFGFWWAAGGNRYVYYMNHYNDAVHVSFHDKGIAHSVRCVKDSVIHEYGTLADARDGQTYRTIKIGEQTWMAQNLNYETDSSCCYSNADSNCVKYGRLYSWGAAKTACPAGYHLPSGTEWDSLAAAVGGEIDYHIPRCACDCDLSYWDGVGKKLKSKTWRGWHGKGTDDYGFSALPGGFRSSGGDFEYAGNDGFWWTATANNRYLYGSHDYMDEFDNGENYGFSVRCVADRP